MSTGVMRHAGPSRPYAAGVDDPDEWWATLTPKRKASIHKWIAKPREVETPEQLGMDPMLDEQGRTRREAMPT